MNPGLQKVIHAYLFISSALLKLLDEIIANKIYSVYIFFLL